MGWESGIPVFAPNTKCSRVSFLLLWASVSPSGKEGSVILLQHSTQKLFYNKPPGDGKP